MSPPAPRDPRTGRRPDRRARRLAPLLCAAAFAGCAKQSTLDPRSDASESIAVLWWWMLAVSVVVLAGALVLLGMAWLRRGRPGIPFIGQRERVNAGVVVFFGIAVPVVALVALFAVANFEVAEETDAPDPATTPITIEVIGHQWFWEVRYPGGIVVTANEIHIPVGTRVTVVARTDDVIHSFWVPQLNRKIDMIPGHPNRVLLHARGPGRYRGQCAEFCGLQHAHMGLYVYAQEPERFRAWLAGQRRPAAPPRMPAQRRGRRVFLDNACASCHTIRGTPARGSVGPDLTHLQSRRTIAALMLPNTPSALQRWVRDPQDIKPGTRMPALNLDARDLSDVVAYLESLR